MFVKWTKGWKDVCRRGLKALAEQEGQGQAGWEVVTAISEHLGPGGPGAPVSWWHRVMSLPGHSPPHHRAGGLLGSACFGKLLAPGLEEHN